MACYGWTLPEAMDVTVPQVKVLMRAMEKYPPPVLLLGAIVGKDAQEGKKDVALNAIAGGEGSVVQAGAEFWRALTGAEDSGG